MTDEVHRIDPPRPVLVLHDDGAWYTGWQDGWVSRANSLLYASVSYAVARDESYERLMPGIRVRPVGE